MIKAHKGLGEKLTFNKSVLNSRHSAKKSCLRNIRSTSDLKRVCTTDRKKRHGTKKIL